MGLERAIHIIHFGSKTRPLNSVKQLAERSDDVSTDVSLSRTNVTAVFHDSDRDYEREEQSGGVGFNRMRSTPLRFKC